MEFVYIFLLTLFSNILNKIVVNSESFGNVKNEVDIVVFSPSADGHDTLRPIADSTQALNVTIDWNMVSINDFDETNGYIEVSGFITLEWNPDGYTPSATNITEMLRNDKMWTPSVILVNSLKGYEVIGYDTSVKVRINLMTLQCEWQPWIITRVACTPNVQYYPFDRQSCAFKFSVWGYTDSEVNLSPKSSEWGFLYFEENGEWEIVSTSSQTNVVGDSSTIDFKIELKRRPLYYVINLISPVILLGAVNAFAFLLPAESGERVSFAITCFLAYVVLLNTIMGFLPTSAAPLSYLSYYTFIMMLFSAAVSLMTVISIRIHHKSENDYVPGCLSALYKCFTCKFFETSKRPTNRVRNITTGRVSVIWDVDDSPVDKQETGGTHGTQGIETEDNEKVSWKKVAALLDVLLFLAFLGGQAFFSVAYLVPIFVN